jgi:hypothetical protein
MKFTIITGPGRCGTSALTQLFINSNLYRVDAAGIDPNMKAGLESRSSILINSLIYTSNLMEFVKDHAYHEIKNLFYKFDLVKSPLFFYTNSYTYWQEVLKPYGGIQVILLTRDNLDDIFTSAKNIGRQDWSNHTPTSLSLQWNLNVQTLENNNIPFITMEYPQFSKDPNYLFNNLKKLELGNWSPTLEEITTLSKKTFTT